MELIRYANYGRNRRNRIPVDCPICGRPAIYHYYNAHCCEGCKQFFRRVIVSRKNFVCAHGGQCQVGKGTVRWCNGCRLDKCLLVGMDPLLINTQLENDDVMREFKQKLMDRKIELQISRQFGSNKGVMLGENDGQENITSPASITPNFPVKQLLTDHEHLQLLVYIESKHRSIWNALTELLPGYLEQFNSLEDLLRFPGNILAKAEEFQNVKPQNCDNAKYLANVDQFGIFVPEISACPLIDRFLLVEMAKAMPFFRQLEIEDQVVLLQHVALPICTFLSCFYSAERGADTNTRANGLIVIRAFYSKIYAGYPIIRELGEKMWCKSVQKVKSVGIGSEEFVLLMVILFCNTSMSTKMSHAAKELLYTESVRHSRLLLNLLQRKHGAEKGASKYAEQIHLLNTMINIKHLSDSNLKCNRFLLIYLPMFHPYFELINVGSKLPILKCPSALETILY